MLLMITNKDIILYTLNGLPSKYVCFVSIDIAFKFLLTFDEIYGSLLNQEEQLLMNVSKQVKFERTYDLNGYLETYVPQL